MDANEKDTSRRAVSNVSMTAGESSAKSGRDDFDFMLGDWDAHIIRYSVDGVVVQENTGSWSAQLLFDGKIVEDLFVERADGVDDAGVITLRTYSSETEQWEMVFLWADRPASSVTSFVGKRVDGEMHLGLQRLMPDGGLVESRIRFFEITNDSFSWENRTSFDEGETWNLMTLITVQRRKGDS